MAMANCLVAWLKFTRFAPPNGAGEEHEFAGAAGSRVNETGRRLVG
jgi:hypothetical protein